MSLYLSLRKTMRHCPILQLYIGLTILKSNPPNFMELPFWYVITDEQGIWNQYWFIIVLLIVWHYQNREITRRLYITIQCIVYTVVTRVKQSYDCASPPSVEFLIHRIDSTKRQSLVANSQTKVFSPIHSKNMKTCTYEYYPQIKVLTNADSINNYIFSSNLIH